MDQAIRRRVHSPHLRQLLGRFATYVGASPYQAPATLSVIAHVELTGGVWYPQGGVYAIADAMHRLAVELGVKIYANSPVRQIETSPGGHRQGHRPAPAGRPPCAGRHSAGQCRRDHRLHPLAQSRPSTAAAAAVAAYGHLLLRLCPAARRRGRTPAVSAPQHLLQRRLPRRIRRYLRPRPCRRRTRLSTWRSPPRATPPTRRRAARTGSCSSTPPPWAPTLTGQHRRSPIATVVFDTLARFGLDIRPKVRSEVMLTPQDIQPPHRRLARRPLRHLVQPGAQRLSPPAQSLPGRPGPLFRRRHDPPRRRRPHGHPVGQSSSRIDLGRYQAKVGSVVPGAAPLILLHRKPMGSARHELTRA